MGEFEVAGCEGSSPTLLLTRGVTYTLLQVARNTTVIWDTTITSTT